MKPYNVVATLRGVTMRKVGLLAGAAAVSLAFNPGSAVAQTYYFRNVQYNYTVSNTDIPGTAYGSFDYDGDNTTAGLFSNVNITFSSADYVASSSQNGPQTSVTYDGGATGVYEASTNRSTLYFWLQSSVSKDVASSAIALTLSGALNPTSTGGVFDSIVNGTANDQFCNSMGTSLTGNGAKALGNCTSQKNNLTFLEGEVSNTVPSPGIALGLLPITLLALKRKKTISLGSATNRAETEAKAL